MLIFRKKLRLWSLLLSGKKMSAIFKGTRKHEVGDGQEKNKN